MKILYAEDEPNIRELTLELLKRRDYRVSAVTDGDELLKELESGHCPDVIVTDNNMRRVSGLEVLKRLRSDWRFRSLPVIVYSAYGNIKPVVESLGGVFVGKMSPVDSLFAALNKVASNIAKNG